jgi:Tfp pilus assembly protein PilV
MRRPRHVNRRGISLLESIFSFSIMLIGLVAINQLLDTANSQATTVEDRSQAIQLAQSKINELAGGILPLSGASGDFSDIDSDLKNWQWRVEAEPHTVNGIWKVRVTVTHHNNDVPAAVLDQFILDPAQRGSPLDTVTVADSSDTGSSQGGSSSTTPSTTTPSSSSGTKPATGSGGGTTTPAATTPASSGGRSTGGGTRSGP